MKKILAILLCAALFAALCACGDATRSPASHTDIPRQPEKYVETPEQSAPQPPVQDAQAENPALAGRETETTMELPENGKMTETKVMLCGGMFTDGPAFSLYGDESCMFGVRQDRGFVLSSEGDAPEKGCAMELCFVPDRDADDLAPGLLDSYDEIVSLEDEGRVAFAGGVARSVRGESKTRIWHGLVVELPEGAVELVLCAMPGAEAAMTRMEALADTLEIVSMY